MPNPKASTKSTSDDNKVKPSNKKSIKAPTNSYEYEMYSVLLDKPALASSLSNDFTNYQPLTTRHFRMHPKSHHFHQKAKRAGRCDLKHLDENFKAYLNTVGIKELQQVHKNQTGRVNHTRYKYDNLHWLGTCQEAPYNGYSTLSVCLPNDGFVYLPHKQVPLKLTKGKQHSYRHKSHGWVRVKSLEMKQLPTIVQTCETLLQTSSLWFQFYYNYFNDSLDIRAKPKDNKDLRHICVCFHVGIPEYAFEDVWNEEDLPDDEESEQASEDEVEVEVEVDL